MSRIPACIGWVSNTERECVGGKNPDTGKNEDACSYFDRCTLIQNYCKAKGIDVNDHIKPVEPVDAESFEKILTQAKIFHEGKTVKKADVEEEKPKPKKVAGKKTEAPTEEQTVAVPEPTEPVKEEQEEKPTKAESKRTYTKPVKSDIDDFDEFLLIRPIVEEIGNALGKFIGEGYAGNVDSKDLAVGTVFLKDKTPAAGGNSRYVTFYIKREKGKGLGALLLVLRKGGEFFNVEFPTLPESVKLPNVGDCSDGQFKAMIKDYPAKDWKQLVKEFQRLYGAKKICQGIHEA